MRVNQSSKVAGYKTKTMSDNSQWVVMFCINVCYRGFDLTVWSVLEAVICGAGLYWSINKCF